MREPGPDSLWGTRTRLHLLVGGIDLDRLPPLAALMVLGGLDWWLSTSRVCSLGSSLASFWMKGGEG